MAKPITINVIREPDWLATDRLQLEVDSIVQPDRIHPQPPGRARQGYGYGSHDQVGYGFGPSRPYGTGVYSGGYLGQGADALVLQTSASFVAGDYSVRLRAVDRLGNAGDWSDAATIEHRPKPPKPTNLAVAAGVLTWTWSDP